MSTISIAASNSAATTELNPASKSYAFSANARERSIVIDQSINYLAEIQLKIDEITDSIKKIQNLLKTQNFKRNKINKLEKKLLAKQTILDQLTETFDNCIFIFNAVRTAVMQQEEMLKTRFVKKSCV